MKLYPDDYTIYDLYISDGNLVLNIIGKYTKHIYSRRLVSLFTSLLLSRLISRLEDEEMNASGYYPSNKLISLTKSC